jgi:hypothetical protein
MMTGRKFQSRKRAHAHTEMAPGRRWWWLWQRRTKTVFYSICDIARRWRLCKITPRCMATGKEKRIASARLLHLLEADRLTYSLNRHLEVSCCLHCRRRHRRRRRRHPPRWRKIESSLPSRPTPTLSRLGTKVPASAAIFARTKRRCRLCMKSGKHLASGWRQHSKNQVADWHVRSSLDVCTFFPHRAPCWLIQRADWMSTCP